MVNIKCRVCIFNWAAETVKRKQDTTIMLYDITFGKNWEIEQSIFYAYLINLLSHPNTFRELKFEESTSHQ